MPQNHGPIAWMAKNSVASNLLMFILLLGGLLSLLGIKQEVFPEFELDSITVSVAYPGASPTEVEQSIVLAVEEAVNSFEEIKTISSNAYEGLASVRLQVRKGEDINVLLSDVKNAVDRITSFPQDIEEPAISIAQGKNAVVSLVIAGDYTEKMLFDLAEKTRSDLLALDEITQVDIAGTKPLEVTVEISQEKLESFGLSLNEVAQQIRMQSVEIPGGSVDTKAGTKLVRVSDRKISKEDFDRILIKGTANGQEVALSEVAEITDGFEESDVAYYYNGKLAVRLVIYRVGDERPGDVSEAVKKYIKETKPLMPNELEMTTWNDTSLLLVQRIDLLSRNAAMGLTLVLIVLSMFLKRNIAIWVAVGIPISFLGTFLILSPMDISINMITLFALIVTLGMVVDDAIIVSENVYQHIQMGKSKLQAAIDGGREMAVPVTFSILTTMAAFSPFLFVPGVMGKILYFIPVVVLAVLFLSLVESFFVLPSHLAHVDADKESNFPPFRWIDNVQERCNGFLQNFINTSYQRGVRSFLKRRYLFALISVVGLIFVLSTPKMGILKTSFMPKVEGDYIIGSMRLTFGVPIEETVKVSKLAKEAFDKTVKELGAEEKVNGYLAMVGAKTNYNGPAGSYNENGTHFIGFEVTLVNSDDREFTTDQFANIWKKHMPDLDNLEAFILGGGGGPSAGKDIMLQLSHTDKGKLIGASRWLEKKFREYPELTDVDNSYVGGKPQLTYTLKPGAIAMGVTSNAIGQAVRGAFFGAEALREQRGRHQVKVQVRLPKSQRVSENNIDDLLVKTPRGGMVPLHQLAAKEYSYAPTEITREDGRERVFVSANVDVEKGNANELTGKFEKGLYKEMLREFPGLQWTYSGAQKEQAESMDVLKKNFIFVLFIIFSLLAIPFRSYLQPVIVMIAIPFGVVGAFTGHILLGYELSFISMLGIVALSGVVVNDSLVLVEAVNRIREKGVDLMDAIVQGSMRRFRPIVLTSLTTFFGLMPMIFETSMQAKFLIPMAISLGFGALFVTVIVLYIVPGVYMTVEDIKALYKKELWFKIICRILLALLAYVSFSVLTKIFVN